MARESFEGAPEAWIEAAARNNAMWCDAVCRSHGLVGTFSPDAWTSQRRTPAFYPDAVTLRTRVDPARLLRGIDTKAPGASIKDSFADLDLASHGFRVLFHATWVARVPHRRATSGAAGPRWVRVRDAETFRRWELAWREADGQPAILLPALLDDPAVTILARPAGETISAGAIAFASGSSVGLGNFFCRSGDPVDAWAGAVRAAGATFPAATIVGYESNESLALTLRLGFSAIGPLRVWVADER